MYASVMSFLTDEGKNERKQRRPKDQSVENKEEAEDPVEIPLDDHSMSSSYSL